MLPVLRAYDQREAQLRIDSFLQFRQRFAKIKSRRLQKAVTGITGEQNPDIVLGEFEPGEEGGEKQSKRNGASRGRKRKVVKSGEDRRASDEARSYGSEGMEQVCVL